MLPDNMKQDFLKVIENMADSCRSAGYCQCLRDIVAINAELLAAAEDYVSKTDDPVTHHPSPRCGCGDCSVITYERLQAAITDVRKAKGT